MKNDLFINGLDAWEKWGISLDSSALSALMTPPGMKDVITVESRLENGRRAINNNPKVASRDVTLTLNLVANSEEEFFSKYSSFCEELKTGNLEITTKYQQSVAYKCIYISCVQFAQFMRGIAKFSLKLQETNPEDRTPSYNISFDSGLDSELEYEGGFIESPEMRV